MNEVLDCIDMNELDAGDLVEIDGQTYEVRRDNFGGKPILVNVDVLDDASNRTNEDSEIEK